VILDDVIYDLRVLEMAVETLPAEQVFFVGIRCPLAVAQQRERERGTRAQGGARTFHDRVHVHGVYDLEVDSAKHSAIECAMQIRQGLLEKPTPSAFCRMRTSR
jgi:chloramphenicol 3-O phosphotransferase